MNTKAMIAGAVTGLITAIGVDVHAWSTTDGPFNWAKAVKRWVGGAMGGILTAMGMSQVA